MKQIDPHTSRIRPGLWTVSEGWRVARSALGGRWCTRACPRHARKRVSQGRHPFACAACANVPGIGVLRVARIAGFSTARCLRKHCRAMALQSALRLTPGSWASQKGCPRSRQTLGAKGREARQRNRAGPSQAQSRPMTRAASRHQTRALRPAPGPVPLKVVQVPFYSLQDGVVTRVRGTNEAGQGRIMKTRRGMSGRGHMMAVCERPHSMSAPWLRAARVLARSHKMG